MAGSNQNITYQVAGTIVAAVIITVGVMLSFGKLATAIEVLTKTVSRIETQMTRIDERHQIDQRDNDNRLTRVETKLGVNTP